MKEEAEKFRADIDKVKALLEAGPATQKILKENGLWIGQDSQGHTIWVMSEKLGEQLSKIE